MRLTFPNRLLLTNGLLFLIGAPLLNTRPAVALGTDRCPDPSAATSPFALDYQGLETRSPVGSAFVLPG